MIVCVCVVVTALGVEGQDSVTANGFQSFYHANGKLSSEGTMKNGKPEGYWKTYYESGALKSEGNRKNHQLDSTWTFYSEEGAPLRKINYQGGLRQGITESYSIEGFLLSKIPFEADVKKGKGFFYYENGVMQFMRPFADGVENGQGYEYAKNGMIISLIKYKNGYIEREERINRKDKDGLKQGVWKEFYDNMQVKWEGRFVNNLRNGYFREYARNGELLNTLKYENGQLIENPEELTNLEVVTEFYADARVKTRGTLKNGVKEGAFREYDEEGDIVGAQLFRNGRVVGEGILDETGFRQGHWKEFYYPEGNLKAEGDYKDGVRVGLWVFYHRNGEVEQKGKYDSKGRYSGLWTWYFESGNIHREENYRAGIEDGLLTEFNDTGAVVTQGEFIDGLEEGEWTYDVGDHYEIGNYRDGMRFGTWKHYFKFDKDKLNFEGEFLDDLPIGKHTYYHPNGRKKLEGKYEAGMKNGEWKRYHTDGTVLVAIVYRMGEERKIDGLRVRYNKIKAEDSDDSGEENFEQ